jgi:hypothetical protein
MKRIIIFILISFILSILVVGSNIYIDKVYEDASVQYQQCKASPEKTQEAKECLARSGIYQECQRLTPQEIEYCIVNSKEYEECLKVGCLLVFPGNNLAKTKDYIEMTIWFFPLLLIILGGYYTFFDKEKKFKKVLYGSSIPAINGLLFVIMLFIWGFSSLNIGQQPMRSEDVFMILGAYLVMLVLSFGLNSLIYTIKRK